MDSRSDGFSDLRRLATDPVEKLANITSTGPVRCFGNRRSKMRLDGGLPVTEGLGIGSRLARDGAPWIW